MVIFFAGQILQEAADTWNTSLRAGHPVTVSLTKTPFFPETTNVVIKKYAGMRLM